MMCVPTRKSTPPFAAEDDHITVSTMNADMVNTIRKADWTDATMGMVRFNLPQDLLIATYAAIPEAGFHNVLLLSFGSRLFAKKSARTTGCLKDFQMVGVINKKYIHERIH